jgi:thioester reductase-like protein
VTHVIHCAGSVKLTQPLETARIHAVDAARHVVKLCKDAAQVGQFKKLEFVSTVGVAGRIMGLVSEQPLRQPRRFHNTYEQAKAEAETYLLGEMQAGLSATIHRPSMVVGDSQTGKIMHFQVFYHLCEFLSGRRTYGILPNFGDWRLDIIPSDYVAKAIYLSSNQSHTLGKIFHLCSGPEQALPLAELAQWMNRLLVRPGEKPYRICTLPRGWIRGLMPLLSLCVGHKSRRALQTLPHFLAYLDEKPMFDNRETRAFFTTLGLNVPPVEGYFNILIRYYLESRHLQSRFQARSTNLSLLNPL